MTAKFYPTLAVMMEEREEKEAAAARLAAEQETARVWQSLHSSASEGLDAEASAKMHKFTSRLETWHGERMAMFDEDAEFREKQVSKYGSREGYSSSVLSVVDSKIADDAEEAKRSLRHQARRCSP